MNESLQAQIISELLKINAVSVTPTKPYRYASGMLSPIYTDLRMTISEPRLRHHIVAGLVMLIQKHYPTVTAIGGVATAGIPHAAWVADVLNLPLVYIRAKAKDHGAGKQIEGTLTADDQVVLIDDLISTGGSVLKTVAPVEATGAKVLGVAAVFSYALPDATTNFAEQQLPLAPVITYPQLLKYLQQHTVLSATALASAKAWHQDPWHWQPAVNVVQAEED